MTDTTERIEPLSAEEEAALREDVAIGPEGRAEQVYGYDVLALLATLDRDRQDRDETIRVMDLAISAQHKALDRDRSAANERIAVLEGALRWALAGLEPFTHSPRCTPLECHCGYWAARAALEAREGEETT